MGNGSNMRYLKLPNLTYVLRPPSSMLGTHVPADPLWQFSSTPISMKSFVLGGEGTYLNCSSTKPYPYQKYLAAYKALPESKKEVVFCKRAYKFYPVEANLEALIHAYHRAAYPLVNGKYDEEQIKLGIAYYTRSAQLLKKQKNKKPGLQLFKHAKEGVEYGRYRLQSGY